MTELEATRILNEARTVNPRFVEGRHMFVVRQDGKVNVWRAVGKSGMRWASDSTVAGDACWLPKRVRERALYETGGQR